MRAGRRWRAVSPISRRWVARRGFVWCRWRCQRRRTGGGARASIEGCWRMALRWRGGVLGGRVEGWGGFGGGGGGPPGEGCGGVGRGRGVRPTVVGGGGRRRGVSPRG